MKHHRRIPCALAAMTLIATLAHGESIFTWEDDQGITHFGSKPPPRDAKPIDLDPDVVRGPLANPQAELENRVRQYRRYIDLMRTMRAAQLGISRERLDALERAGLIE